MLTNNHLLSSAFAVVLACALASSQAAAEGASVDDATKAELKTAMDTYERGITAMDASRFQEALELFQQSYATVSSPNSRLMVGRALVKLGRFAEAFRVLTQTVQYVNSSAAAQKKYKKTLDSAQKELDEIKDKLAYLTIRQGAQVQIQGQPVAFANWNEPQPVMPGAVSVEVALADGRKLQNQLVLKPGEKSEFTVESPAPPAPPPPKTEAPKVDAPKLDQPSTVRRNAVGYVAGAVGIVGVGAFVGFALVGASSYGDSNANCTPQGCPASAIDNEGGKAMLKGIGYTGLGIGVIGLGTATWLLLGGGGDSAPKTALRIAPNGILLDHKF